MTSFCLYKSTYLLSLPFHSRLVSLDFELHDLRLLDTSALTGYQTSHRVAMVIIRIFAATLSR